VVEIKKIIEIAICITLFIIGWPALAESEATLKVTVKSELVAVSINPSVLDYGSIAFCGTKDTTGQQILARNDGNVPERFEIKGDDMYMAGGSCVGWSLEEDANASCSVDKFKHLYTIDSTDRPLTKAYAVFVSGMGSSGTYPLRLKVVAPSAGSVSGSLETYVYVRATAS